MKNLIWINIRNSFLLILCIVLFILFINWVDGKGQVILFSEGAIFEKGIYYDNNEVLDRIYSQYLNWDRWVEDGYLDRRGIWYTVKFPEYEYWKKNMICYEVKDSTLKWFHGKKYFGWDEDDPVEPIVLHHREFRFRMKKGNVIEKEKGILLKTNSSGYQDLKDIVYKGLKGATVSFDKRKKPKGKVMGR